MLPPSAIEVILPNFLSATQLGLQFHFKLAFLSKEGRCCACDVKQLVSIYIQEFNALMSIFPCYDLLGLSVDRDYASTSQF